MKLHDVILPLPFELFMKEDELEKLNELMTNEDTRPVMGYTFVMIWLDGLIFTSGVIGAMWICKKLLKLLTK